MTPENEGLAKRSAPFLRYELSKKGALDMMTAANDNWPMTGNRTLSAKEFSEIQRKLGMSDAELAAALHLSPINGKTRVRRIKRGKLRCSEVMAQAMLNLLDISAAA